MKNLTKVIDSPGVEKKAGEKDMQNVAVIGSGLEDVATSRYEGSLFRSNAFEKDPRLSGLVNSSLAEFNDLPPNLARLMEVLGDAMSDAKAVAKVVELNPALAAKVLKHVNSSFAGLRGKISNLKRAVTILGFNHIRSLLLGTSVFMRHRHHKLPPTLPLSELWRHSVAVSQIAGAMGDAIGNVDSATLVSGGLLHDAGKLVLASVHPPKFADCITAVKENGGNLVEYEIKTIGITDPLLSGALSRMWNLPQRLMDLIMLQSHPHLASDTRLVTILQLAQYLAAEHEMGDDGDKHPNSIVDQAVKVLGIPPEKVTRLVDHNRMDEIVQNLHIMSEWE